MSLSKQLYIIISFIFIILFVGNTVITIQNTKEYLELESTSKAKDTATSLGMILKSFISNKKDPEIASTINAIADSGFYSSIRLEDSYYSFSDKELLQNNTTLDGLLWEIKDIKIDKKYGEIIINTDDTLADELNELEGLEDENIDNIVDKVYTFIPTKEFKDNDILKISFSAIKENKKIDTNTNLKLLKTLVDSTRAVKFDAVPLWFIKLIPIELKEQSSQINDDWKKAAIIYVKANAGVAYLKLYEQIKDAVIYSLFAFVIAILLLVLFLKLILKPLKDIEKLANEISKGSFEKIKKLPWTRELKSVSISMNTMSGKIQSIISKLNKNIKEVSEQLIKDPLTNLEVKESFVNDIKDIFISKKDGYMCLVQITQLGEFAHVNGRNSVNDFLIEFANILKNTKNFKAYRFYGAEFAMLAKDVSLEDMKTISQNLTKQFDKLGEKIGKPNIANIGIAPFNQLDTLGGVLSGASEAYEMAKQIGPNEIFIKKENTQSRGMLEWKELVFDIIDNQKVNIDYIGDIKNKNNNTIIQEAFSNMIDKDGKDIPIGIFLSIAQENHKVIDFDKIIIKKVINHIKIRNIKHQISINLSIDSIKDVQFLSWLKDIIRQNNKISQQLIFSLTAYNVAKYIDLFKEFVKLIKNNNSQIMIKRFDVKFIQIEQIKDINPDSIRLARDYTNGICKDTNKKSLVDAICKISGLLDIKIYAENVKDDVDLEMIKVLELDGVSR